ncbi:GTP cyclohydrolase I FolE [Actinomyces sp. F1_1611]|uniref:GTP cyclohydrolase 1 n=2 Tax=Scrofimicrobium appendicitidis TaxID=3079930 RepID=A0AAU7V6D8_9ACTO
MVDQDAIREATRALLAAIGEDPDRDGLRRTPDRVARSWAELVRGYDEDPRDHLRTTFAVDSKELVLVRDIEFRTLCEHHLLPFSGHAHVAYLPSGGRVTGLSKIGRLVEGYARRLQVQERLTTQVADAVEEMLAPRGLAVIMQAEHLCMSMRGVAKPGATTLTSVFRGELDSAQGRSELFGLIGMSGLHR